MTRLASIIAIWILGFAGFAADPLPSDRRITWQGHVGVPGGIPVRTNIYTMLPAGSSRATKAMTNLPAAYRMINGVDLL